MHVGKIAELDFWNEILTKKGYRTPGHLRIPDSELLDSERVVTYIKYNISSVFISLYWDISKMSIYI